MKRAVLGAAGVAALLAAALVWAHNAPVTSGASLAFEARFDTSSDFYDRFDRGYSGHKPVVRSHQGDHDTNCGGPTTSRTVTIPDAGTDIDFSQVFWHCAPGGDPAKGHVMTAVDTTGYDIAWFSPKPTFSGVSRVCWDINETDMGGRKWTQVMFVSEADAVRYPAGTVTYAAFPPNGVARGTGGFDLGFTSPDFRDPNGPTTKIHPQGGTLAGVKLLLNGPSWFQNQDNWTVRYDGPSNIITGITDKAARYQHCVSNEPNNVVRLTQATPNGTRTFDMPGQIPQHPVRVVFQDDNYDPPKDAGYHPDRVTLHWDNIQVFTGDGAPATTAPPTTAPPTTPAPTTAAPTTVAPTTAAPTTAAATSAPTTVAPTTAAPTTAAPTTAPTTAAPTTAAPTTAAPTTAAPTTAAPTTAPPTTAAPTTAPPTTAAPTTAAPTTAAPTTAAPTTAPPTTVAATVAPATVAPTTAAPATAAPTTVATTPAPTTTAAPPTTASAPRPVVTTVIASPQPPVATTASASQKRAALLAWLKWLQQRTRVLTHPLPYR